MSSRVGIVGASGYSGAIAARLVCGHPAFTLAFCTSDRVAGEPIDRFLGVPTPRPMTFDPNAAAASLASRCDAVILATSAQVSTELAPAYLEAGKHVIDLSGGFRLEKAGDYSRWYGFEHPAISWLARAHYGLPELFGAPPRTNEPTLVSNPGCYPTASLLAIAPLVRAGLVEPAGIVIDAKSGVTGAGRKATEEFSFGEVDEDLRAYRLLSHQHTPEIVRMLRRFADGARLTFTAHLLPLRRGLMATCYARPRAGTTAAHVAQCLADTYAGRAFIEVVTPDQASIASVAGTNRARVGAIADGDVVIAIGTIDNLLKGAAGQAVQNLNLLYGMDETLGLAHLHRMAP
jgi:N-acetyl-gamma-glutamyl-phosphate reductase